MDSCKHGPRTDVKVPAQLVARAKKDAKKACALLCVLIFITIQHFSLYVNKNFNLNYQIIRKYISDNVYFQTYFPIVSPFNSFSLPSRNFYKNLFLIVLIKLGIFVNYDDLPYTLFLTQWYTRENALLSAIALLSGASVQAITTR